MAASCSPRRCVASCEIWTMDADGSNRRALTMDGISAWPSASPDGSFVAFSGVRGEQRGIWRMNPDGTDRRFLAAVADGLLPASHARRALDHVHDAIRTAPPRSGESPAPAGPRSASSSVSTVRRCLRAGDRRHRHSRQRQPLRGRADAACPPASRSGSRATARHPQGQGIFTIGHRTPQASTSPPRSGPISASIASTLRHRSS